MGRRPSRLPTGDCGVADWRELDPSVPIHPNARSPEDVFRDFLARRAGIVNALTKDLWAFYQACEPEKKNLCLYGLPNETWEVSLPAEEVPSELPQPALGINFSRDDLPLKRWLALVAAYSDSWLLSVAFYYGARFGFDKEARRQLFILISGLPTVYEVVTGSAKKQHKTPNGNSKNKSSSQSSKQPSSNSKPTKCPPPKYEEQIGKEPKYEEHIGNEAKYEEQIGKDEGCEDQEYLCGICEGRYVTGEFWIGCDFCVKWFHGECVCITAAKAEYIKQYKCPSCSTKRSGVIMEHF